MHGKRQKVERGRYCYQRRVPSARYLEQHGVDIGTPEKAKGLLVAVDRANVRIQRIRQIVERIRNTYRIQMDTQAQQYLGWVEGNLTEAKTHLEPAREALVQYKNVTVKCSKFFFK
jgi:hypothetical protein